MARPKNTQVRREEIVRGLLQVMARHGWEGASVGRIARAARITPGLVHYHFIDKREILLELLSLLEQKAADRVNRKVGTATTAMGRVEAFVDAHLAAGRESEPDAVACWVAISAEAVRDARVKAALESTLRRSAARMEELLADALDDAGRPKTGAKAGAAAIVSAVLGAFTVSAAAPGLIPAGTAAASVRALAAALVRGAAA